MRALRQLLDFLAAVVLDALPHREPRHAVDDLDALKGRERLPR